MNNKYNNLKRIFIVLFAALALTMSSETALAQTSEPKPIDSTTFFDSRNGLEGTWLATVTFEDDFSLKVLFTFMAGREDNEGTMIDQNEYQFTPNPVCTADQGVWKKIGNRRFIATHLAFCFDATADYAPAGSVKVRDTINLNNRGDEFTGRQHIEIYDVDGNLTAEFDAEMEGTRINAQAPPPAAGARGGSSLSYQKLLRFGVRKQQE